MRNMLISVLALFVVVGLQAQDRTAFKSYSPRTLSAGTAMTARTMDTNLSDTTSTIDTRGFSYVGLSITGSSDSIGVLVAIQGSQDGQTFSALSVIDSVISRSTGVTGIGAVSVPDKWLAFPWIRFRVYASADAGFGANPAPTINFQVIRRY